MTGITCKIFQDISFFGLKSTQVWKNIAKPSGLLLLFKSTVSTISATCPYSKVTGLTNCE